MENGINYPHHNDYGIPNLNLSLGINSTIDRQTCRHTDATSKLDVHFFFQSEGKTKIKLLLIKQ
jgi:hypothetical protein